MKKARKILAAVLVCAILLGMLVVSAFASGNQLVPQGSYDGMKQITAQSSDFEGASGEHLFGQPKNLTGAIGEIVGPVDRYSSFKVENYSGNKFMSWYHDGQFGTATNQAYYGLMFGGYNNSSYGAIYYDFITIDFDFTATKYLDENGKLTDTNTGNPAYLNNLGVKPIVRYYNSSSELTSIFDVFYSQVKFVNEDGNWYFAAGENRVKLSNQIYNWSHVTIQFKIDNTVTYGDGTEGTFDFSKVADITSYHLSRSEAYVYFNGEYVSTITGCFPETFDDPNTFIQTNSTTGAKTYLIDKFGFDQLRLDSLRAEATKAEFSMGIDNVSVYYFESDYSGPLSTKAPETPTYESDDMVFYGNYKLPAPTKPVISIQRGDETFEYYITGVGLKSIQEGDTVDITRDIFNVTPTCSFTVNANGHKFEVDPASGYKALYDAERGIYSVSPAEEDDQILIFWGTDGTTSNAIVNTTPTSPTDISTTPTYKGTDENGKGLYEIVSGWAVVGGSLDGQDITKIVLTPEIIDEYKNGLGAIEVTLISETVTFDYAVTDENGVIAPDENGGYDAYGDITTFKKALEIAPSNSTVKLYADAFISNNTNLGERNLFIDLNGHKIVLSAVTSKPSFMSIDKSNTTLVVYSSVPGGEIHGSSYQTSGAIQGAALFQIKPIKNATLQIGAYDAYSGDNLSTYAIGLVDVNGAGYTEGNQYDYSNPNRVIINGGRYFRNISDSFGLLIVRGNAVIEAKDAFFAATASAPVLAMDDRYVGKLEAAFDNCTLLTNEQNNIINQLFANSSVEFNGCKLIGTLGISQSKQGTGKILLGEGTMLAGNSIHMDEFISYAEDCRLVRDGKLINIDLTSYVMSYDKSTQTLNPSSYTDLVEKYTDYVFGYIVMTKADADIADGRETATVIFKDGDGNILATEELPVGVYVSRPGTDVPDWFDKNGWIKYVFAGWENELGSQIVEAGENVFTPVGAKTFGLSNVKINVTTTTNFEFNFYIPANWQDAGIESMTILENNTEVASWRISTVTIGGESYIKIKSYPGASEPKTQRYTVKVVIDGVEYTETLSYSIPEYFEDALKVTTSESAKRMLVNAVAYINEIYKAAKAENADGYDTYNAILANEEYKAYLIDSSYEALSMRDDFKAALAVDVSNLKPYFTSVFFDVNEFYRPVYKFVYDPDVLTAPKATDLNITYKGLHGDASYTSEERYHYPDKYQMSGPNVSIYDMTEVITINLTVGGEAYSGTYSLAAYIAGCQEQGQDTTIARLIYAYAVAAREYKTTND